ncbi:hypothetical protein TrVFT333_009435 [Trichoderma virens FT-333]|nr:hypothetical protein TrVFT333_009435 [Trichoderma virens FT-333]
MQATSVSPKDELLAVIAEELGMDLDDLSDDTDISELRNDTALSRLILKRVPTSLQHDISRATFSSCTDIADLKAHVEKAMTRHEPFEASDKRESKLPIALLLKGNEATAKKKVFLLPDGSGSGMAYMSVPPIDPSVCLYGINSPYLYSPEFFNGTIDDLARIWTAEIQRIQPKGPYTLGGCGGGTPKWLVKSFVSTIGAVEKYMPTPMVIPKGAAAPEVFIIWASDGVFPKGVEAYPELDMNVRVTRFLVNQRTEFGPLGWDKLFPGQNISIAKMPGSHFMIVHPPNVGALGELLRDVVEGCPSHRKINWQIFEKSTFVGEIGAALGLTPNGGRVLERLGFSFQKARTCTIKTWANIDGITFNTLNQLDLSNARQAFGAPSQPVTLKLGSQVTEAHPDGTVILKDGSRYTADMVVGADGLRSVIRDAVLSENDQAKPVHSGQAAFRFLVNTSTLRSDPILSPLADDNTDRLSLFADTSETTRERHAICGEVQNFVGIHPSMEVENQKGDDAKVAMMAEFSHFDKRIIRMIEIRLLTGSRLAENVKRWPLYIHDPYPTWVKGRIVLVGDAAHPMLPYGGQGAMMAIEDGGILGALFANVLPDQIDARLSKYQQLRKNRVSRVQMLSQVRVGREKEVDTRISQYADGPNGSIPMTHKERTIHDYRLETLPHSMKRATLIV